MTDPLFERVVAAVAQRYRELPLEDAKGLLLAPQWDDDAWQLAPDALELTVVDEDVRRDGYQEELGQPDIASDPELFALCEELNARYVDVQGGDLALEEYWLALATKIQSVLGMPVLVAEIGMPIDEQLRRQLGAQGDDPLAGMNVLVSVRIDAHRVAAVVLRENSMEAFSRVTDPLETYPLGPGLTEVGRDPQVVAGMLPRGAAGVVVQDRAGAWHEAAVDHGAWLSVLAQRGGSEDPPFAYVDADGKRFEPDASAWVFQPPHPEDRRRHEGVVLRGATVPAVWVTQTHLGPFFWDWEGPREAATALRFVHGEWDVRISVTPTTATEAYRERLLAKGLGFAGAKKRMRKVACSPLPGTLEGRPVELELAAPSEPWMRDEGWVAVLRRDGFTVTVQCGGSPPVRLDLVPVG